MGLVDSSPFFSLNSKYRTHMLALGIFTKLKDNVTHFSVTPKDLERSLRKSAHVATSKFNYQESINLY